MNNDELQKEYFVTLRSIINTIKLDVAECVRCGVNPSQMMADMLDTAKQKLDEIIAEGSHEEKEPDYPFIDDIFKSFEGKVFKSRSHLRREIKKLLECSGAESMEVLLDMERHGYHLNEDGDLCKVETTEEIPF